MNAYKSVSVDVSKLMDRFDRLRNQLLQSKYADRLDKPLAYWALLSDRRLPQAFLGRSLRDLITTPFDDLLDTAGVGRKKIALLVILLARAVQDAPPTVADELVTSANGAGHSDRESDGDSAVFDPDGVSEVLWAKWCETVKLHGIGHEALGRLAPRLTILPTAVWHIQLNEYVDRTLSEICSLKTHGEKRVHAILEVFFTVHEALSRRGMQNHFNFCLVPKFVGPLKHWISQVLKRDKGPPVGELRESFVEPLLLQLELDAGENIVELASGRLGVEGPPESVRQQSRRLGVTRARVYQLLEECANVFAVRWPEGEPQLVALQGRWQSVPTEDETLRLLGKTIDLFYPNTRTTAADLSVGSTHHAHSDRDDALIDGNTGLMATRGRPPVADFPA